MSLRTHKLFWIASIAWSLTAPVAHAQLTPPEKKETEEIAPPEGYPEHKDYFAWRELLSKGDFAGLEKVAEELLQDRTKYPNGVDRFWNFSTITFTRNMSEQHYQQSLQALNKWLSAKPKSIPAHLLSARLWSAYASAARGQDYAAKTSPAQLKAYAERSRKAAKHLDEVNKLTKTPGAFYYRMRIDAASGMSKKPDIKWAYEALKTDPQNIDVVMGMAHALLPRWFGKPGDLEAFADEAAKRTSKECGEMHYAVAVVIAKRTEREYVLNAHKFDWSRIKQGLHDWQERFPEAKDLLDHEAQLAWLAGDVDAAVEAVQKLGEKPGRASVWSEIDRAYDPFRQRVNREYLKGDQRRMIINGMASIFAISVIADDLLVSVDKVSGVRAFDYAKGTSEIGMLMPELDSFTFFLDPTTGLAATGNKFEPGVTVYNLTNKQKQAFPGNGTLQTTRTCLSPNSELLVVVDQVGGMVIFDRKSRKKLHDLPVPEFQPRRVESLAFSRKGDFLALACETGELIVLNAKTGKEEASFKLTNQRPVNKVTWSETQLAAATFDGNVIVTDWTERKEVARCKVRLPISCLEFSPDGKTLAFGVNPTVSNLEVDEPLYLWKPGTDPAPTPLKGHKLGVNCVLFAEQGKTVISAGQDWTIRFWDVP